MLTYLSNILGLDCLTSVIWAFTLNELPSLLGHACIVQMLVITMMVSSELNYFHKGIIGSPI